MAKADQEPILEVSSHWVLTYAGEEATQQFLCLAQESIQVYRYHFAGSDAAKQIRFGASDKPA